MSKKGENIYKRKDKRWEARYIKGYDPNGSARYGYCYGKTYREAKEKVERAKAALLMNVPSPEHNRRKRFSHYCDEWLRLNKIRVPHRYKTQPLLQFGYSISFDLPRPLPHGEYRNK